MANISCIVSISDDVFFTTVAASLEAYKVRHDQKTLDDVPVETYGNLWGYVSKSSNGSSIIRAALADVDTSAVTDNSSAAPKKEAFKLKDQFIRTYRPELEYLGNFHSHPYNLEIDKVKNVLDLERKGLFNFSDDDKRYFKQLQIDDNNFRLALAITVFEPLQLVPRDDAYIEGHSCIRFSFDGITLWIKAHAYLASNGAKLPCKNVAIVCPSIGFNNSGF